jgi:hypothetical protein
MQPGDLLAEMAQRLEAAGIPYMVVGSLAGSFHGHPRTTADIDIVIDPSAAALRAFIEGLPADDYYVSEAAAVEAFERRASFNVIEQATGWKADLLIKRDRPFSTTEFERRATARLFGRDTPVATAEDTIIAKLEWAAAGESERQLRDVAGILEVSGQNLDRDYISRWVRQLGLDGAWRRARDLTADAALD